MAHQSLYRIHRPATFAEVVGQEQVTKPLEEAAKSKKIGHAYLFAGSRGPGKSSRALIFASAIGCTENDLYEIDAASNNSVEDIRALTDGVYTLPFASPYKVYILDEVHMLSKGAWNAFLKTLEEPPSHAVFILATTELEKVPETVQSRCQVFEFKKPPRAVLAKMTVAAAPGAPKPEQVHALIHALAAVERGRALAAIEIAMKSGADMKLFLELVLEALRATLLIRYAPDLHASLQSELGADEFSALEKFAKGKGITHATMLAFLTAAERIRYAPIPALPLQLAVLELFAAELKK